MGNKNIILSPEELREIKEEVADDTRFRTSVLMKLRALSGIPEKVTKLGVHSVIHWALIVLLLSLTARALAK